MGLRDRMLGKTAFIDTAPLIYFIEGHSKYQDKLFEIFKANDQGQILFQTSTLTLLEVLVQPIRLNRKDLVERYKHILTTSLNIEIFDIDVAVAREAAQLKADYNLKTPDAIQIASGILNTSTIFLTNDIDLKRVDKIEVATLNG
jgi:predicted nucleic acid-binding protein